MKKNTLFALCCTLCLLLSGTTACSPKVGCPAIDQTKTDKDGNPKRSKSKSQLFAPSVRKKVKGLS